MLEEANQPKDGSADNSLRNWLTKNRSNFSMAPATFFAVMSGTKQWTLIGLDQWRRILFLMGFQWLFWWAILAWIVWPIRAYERRTHFPASQWTWAIGFLLTAGLFIWAAVVLILREPPAHDLLLSGIFVVSGLVGVRKGIKYFRSAYVSTARWRRRVAPPSTEHE